MVLNTKRLKMINVDLVKTALKFQDYGTKNSISSTTGLSVATCRNILDELLLTGEVKEIELGVSTGGRPSRRFVYNENFAFIAILYVRLEGEEKSIYSSVVNMLGAQIFEEYYQVYDVTLKEIDLVVEQLIEKFPGIKVISLGIPGVVQNGVIGQCDFPKLNHIPIQEYLSEKHNRITTVENDVNCASLGYYHKSNKNNPESIVYIYYPQDGLAGAGIIVNGKVLKGYSNFAGEVSYLPLGMEREQQGIVQQDIHKFADLAVSMILSVNCLINPANIVLTGQWISDKLMDLIRASVSEQSIGGHIPQISHEVDIHDSYVDGLKFSGIYKLSCGFEMVEK